MLLRPPRIRHLPTTITTTTTTRLSFFVFLLRPFATTSRRPTHATIWPLVLREAAEADDLSLCRCAHARIVRSGRSLDRLLANNLIATYSKCGSLSSARLVFDHFPLKDVVTWNSLLSACANHGRLQECFNAFRLMLCAGLPLTTLSLTPVLKLSSCSLGTSQAVHCLSVKVGLSSDGLIPSSLVALYSKFGCIDDARSLFDEMSDCDRDAVLWTIMIRAYNQMGLVDEAFSLFAKLHRSGTCAIDSSLCCFLGRQPSGSTLQAQALGAKLCLFEYHFNVLEWNKRMSELVESGEHDSALRCFTEMIRTGVDCDVVSLVVSISAATGAWNAKTGQLIHGMALKAGLFANVSVANSLMNMYSKVRRLDFMRRVFDEVEEVDLISWNSMISSYVQNGMVGESTVLFLNMQKNGTLPDHFTMASILRACSAIVEGVFLCQQVHCLSIKLGLCQDVFVQTSLVDAYAKNSGLREAEFLVSCMNRFDLACCNALISGYIANGESDKALDFSMKLHRRGEILNHFTLATALKACNGLVAFEKGKQVHAYALKLGYEQDMCVSSGILDMYVKCGDMENASAIFSSILEPDEIAWTTMISGYVQNDNEVHALNLYHQMRQSGVLPDAFTLASLVKACSCLTALDQGRQIHANAVKMACFSDVYLGTSFMDMYAKCGSIEDSYLLFNRMGLRNIASWNAMVVGLAQHGNGREALCLFKKMRSQGIRPDKITFVGVLSACSHSGLVSDAYAYFDSMYKDYGIQPEMEHYSCLIDALGRAGLLSEAENVMNTMPFEASASMCRALLGACKIGGNTEIGRRMATKLQCLDPLDSSAYVLLSNMYAGANEWDEVDKERKVMKGKKVKKDPGYSWVEVKNKVHMFVVDDRSHPEAARIYDKLDDLLREIKHEGYVPDTDYALFNVEEEEKERSLYYHSEKLAIAYSLLTIPEPQTIRVIKNLRVCGDCHSAIKYISKVVGRVIVVRDVNRFHHFSHGTCSCNDYW